MKTVVDTQPLDDCSSCSLRRIITTVLDEVAIGCVNGDRKLLDALGVTVAQAKVIESTDRRKLADRIVRSSKGMISVGLVGDQLN